MRALQHCALLSFQASRVDLLRFSSVEREEDQNAAWLSLYIFNKDDNEQYKNNKRNVKNPKQPYLVQTNTETGTITHETLKEYGCLNMVPNQRQ